MKKWKHLVKTLEDRMCFGIVFKRRQGIDFISQVNDCVELPQVNNPGSNLLVRNEMWKNTIMPPEIGQLGCQVREGIQICTQHDFTRWHDHRYRLLGRVPV